MKCVTCGAEIDGACFRCEVQPAMKGECPHAEEGCWESCDTQQCEPAFVEIPRSG